MVVRAADDDLAGDVRIAETQRNTDPGLRATRRGHHAKQQSNENEHPFHGFLLDGGAPREEPCHDGYHHKSYCDTRLQRHLTRPSLSARGNRCPSSVTEADTEVPGGGDAVGIE